MPKLPTKPPTVESTMPKTEKAKKPHVLESDTAPKAPPVPPPGPKPTGVTYKTGMIRVSRILVEAQRQK
jgi:hypothetical protein